MTKNIVELPEIKFAILINGLISLKSIESSLDLTNHKPMVP